LCAHPLFSSIIDVADRIALDKTSGTNDETDRVIETSDPCPKSVQRVVIADEKQGNFGDKKEHGKYNKNALFCDSLNCVRFVFLS
jgi:hypothetical protein